MFCPKCGNMLIPKNGKMVCGVHGVVDASGKITQKFEKKLKEVKIAEKELEVHPKTKEKCPKCNNDEAFYWTIQTRAIDEAPTKFYKCTKCGHQWKEYS